MRPVGWEESPRLQAGTRRRSRPSSSLFLSSGFAHQGVVDNNGGPKGRPLHSLHYPFSFFSAQALCPPWQSHERTAPVPLAHIAQRPLTSVSGAWAVRRMMCHARTAFSSCATMHIKLKWSLHWSGAEPLCERNGCHTRRLHRPLPNASPLLCLCLAFALACVLPPFFLAQCGKLA